MKSYKNSKLYLQESSKYLASGVASSFRRTLKPTPLYIKSASGARLLDVDGNKYIDYLMAYGPLILGHSHEALTQRVSEALQEGFVYGLQHEGEIQLAKRLTEVLPCAEKVTFSGSGTEAVMVALRLARAFTEKQKIVRFFGHYHGWSDAIYTGFPSPDINVEKLELAGTNGQSENALSDVIAIPWNNPHILKETLQKHQNEIAAVITEPVMCNSGCILPLPGYLEQMRELTKELGIVLIFDEVITGFRLGLSGAHGRFGIKPDLVTLAKALAGGVAISALAGKEEIMNLIETGKVSHLGTFNGNCIATSAANATLQALSENNGAAFVHMEAITEKLVTGIRSLLAKHGIQGVINQIGAVFHFMFIDRQEVTDFATFMLRDEKKYSLFAEKMLDEGILVRPNGLWYVSTAHGEEEVSITLEAIDRVLSKLV